MIRALSIVLAETSPRSLLKANPQPWTYRIEPSKVWDKYYEIVWEFKGQPQGRRLSGKSLARINQRATEIVRAFNKRQEVSPWDSRRWHSVWSWAAQNPML